MVSICPQNRTRPVPIDEPCYRCGGRWKIVRLRADEREALRPYRGIVVRCCNCRVVSMATRPAVEERSWAGL
jgi:hypothetical protein